MDNQKLEKLKKLMELANRDTVSPKELIDVVSVLVNIIRKENLKNSDSISQFTSQLEALISRNKELPQSEVKSLVEGLQTHRKDITALIERTKAEVLAQIPNIPEVDLSTIESDIRTLKSKEVKLDTAEQIKIKLETLKKDERLDVSAIKGIEKFSTTKLDKAISILDQRTQFLINKTNSGGISNITGLITAGTNVTLSGVGTTASPYVINSSGGGGSGTVTSVASADGSITVTNPTTTPDLAVVKAPILSTARTIGGVSFDGSANITVATATGGFTVSGGAIKPAANDGTAIGVASTGEWSDLFLAEGGVINWDNGDLTLTQTGDTLVIAGGTFMPSSNGASSIGSNTILFGGGYFTRASVGTGFAVYSLEVGTAASNAFARFGTFCISQIPEATATGYGAFSRNDGSEVGLYSYNTDVGLYAGGVTNPRFYITGSNGNTSVGYAKVDPSAKFGVLSTTEQLRLAYDATHYFSATVASTGSITFSVTGTSPIFTFSQNVALGANSLTMTGSIAATGARVTKGWFTDIESTNMPTVGGTSLSSTFQPLDADLTTIAGLTATTDNFIVSVASAWASRTPAQVRTTLGLVIDTNVQAWDADLDTWAGKTPPSGTVVGNSDTQTLTNKAISKRVVTTTDDATAVIDVTVTDVYELSAVANATTFSTTGSPVDGQELWVRFKDAGVAKGLTWDAIFVVVGVTLPTTTVAGKWHYVKAQYNSSATKFHVLAVAVQA